MSDANPVLPDPEEVWDPYAPQKHCTVPQQEYLRALVDRIHNEANWSGLAEYTAKRNIERLNDVRKSLGLEFKPIAGMDTSRGPR